MIIQTNFIFNQLMYYTMIHTYLMYTIVNIIVYIQLFILFYILTNKFIPNLQIT